MSEVQSDSCVLVREKNLPPQAWNSTSVDYGAQSVVSQFSFQVTEHGLGPAVVCGGECLSYTELNRRANQLARYLIGLGVGREVIVGVGLDRSFELLISILGILKAGGAYLPLDLDYPDERIHFMLGDSGAGLVLTRRSLATSRLEGHVNCLFWDELPEALSLEDDTDLDICRGLDDLAYVMYTSGSTGTPKGVEVVDRGILRLVLGVDYIEFSSSLVMLQMAPISFDASTLEIWGPLLHGGQCVLYPSGVPTIDGLESVLSGAGVNTLWLTSALFNMIIDTQPSILRQVKQLLIGGEALSVGHVLRALGTLGETQIINGYGPTESTTFTTTYSIPRELSPDVSSIPIGRPISNTQVYILDDSLHPVPIGVKGELYIGGDGLARGYVNRPKLTLEKFIKNPFDATGQSRLYGTGDLCYYLSDGNIAFVGRVDTQIKLRGFRIELGEIESVLSQHEDVSQAVVLCREDKAGDKYLVGYLVPRTSRALDIRTLQSYLRQTLPDYMVPAFFVPLDSLPLTPNGKVDRKQLAGEVMQASVDNGFHDAGTKTEETVLSILRELFDGRQVGLDSNFFDIGGNSLLALQLHERIRQSFKRDLSVTAVFEASSVKELAATIDAAMDVKESGSIVCMQPGDDKPPLFWGHYADGQAFGHPELFRLLGSEQPCYSLQLPLQNDNMDGFDSIEKIGDYFAGQLMRFYPDGPFLLAGHSYGAIVVFEVAKQLLKCGREVIFLGLIDTHAVSSKQVTDLRTIIHTLKQLPSWLSDFVTWETGLRKMHVRKYINLLAAGVIEVVNFLGIPLRKIDKTATMLGGTARADQRAVMNRNLKALEKYQKARYPGEITLLRAQIQPLFSSPEPGLGWDEIAEDGVEVIEIPGNHISMMHGKNLPMLANELNRKIELAYRTMTD